MHLMEISMRPIVNLRLIHSNDHMITTVFLKTIFISTLAERPFFSIRHNLDPIRLYTQID